jgi:peroxiredoxin Q/BCP
VTKANTVVVGVSPDGIDSHNQFISKFNLPFILLADQQKETMKAYGAWGPRKNAAGEVSEGTIRSTALIGPDGTIKKHWIPVADAGAHPAEVLEFLGK